MSTPTPPAPANPLVLSIELTPGQLDLLATRVAQVLDENRDDGFLTIEGAARYLNLTRSALYHLVERDKLPHHRAGGRLLFDKSKLRHWIEQQP